MKINLIMCISKILTDLCAIKQKKRKINKYFCKCCLQCFSSEKVLIEHKENCLIISGKQSVKLKSGSISFKNYFKQLPVSFKIYPNFECILKRVRGGYKYNGSYTERYQDHIPCSFAYKIVCIDNKLSKKVVLHRGKIAVYKFIEAILSEYSYSRCVTKKHFNKNLIIRKNIFACLFGVHNTISLSRHEQVCLIRLRFERYFSHHRPT